jgi:hypothetical protein
MKNIFQIILALSLSFELTAQKTNTFRNEFSTQMGVYQGNKQPGTYFFRQNYTHWFLPNLGMGLTKMQVNQSYQSDLKGLTFKSLLPSQIIQTNNRYFDLNLVARLSLKKHSLRLNGGLSFNKLNEISNVANTFVYQPDTAKNIRYNLANGRVSKAILPQLGLAYSYQISPRISASVMAQGYFGKQPATIFGASVNYGFNISSDSLGIQKNKESHYGIIAGAASTGIPFKNLNRSREILPFMGLFYERKIDITWKSRIELIYASRGYNFDFKDDVSGKNSTAKVRIRQIQLPILFKNEFAYKWSFVLGPQFSATINGFTFNGQKNKIIAIKPILGFQVGTSYQLLPKTSIELRLIQDLFSFSNEYDSPSFQFNDIRLGLSQRF